MIKLVCKSCEKITEIPSQDGNVGCYNLGYVSSKSGWKYIPTSYEGNWLCIECAEKARNLALELKKIMGGSWIYIACFLNQNEIDDE